MGALTEDRILAAWELGAGRRPLDQALAILWAADEVDATDLPLSQRNRRLLELRMVSFGAQMELVADCPSCGAMLEVSVSANDLAGSLAPDSPITSRHLAELAGVDPARQADALATAIAPTPVAEAVAQTEIRVSLNCADCGHEWSEPLDPVAPVWSDITAAATGLLRQVALLASAYGWSEAEVLRLSPRRRAAYLQLAGAA